MGNCFSIKAETIDQRVQRARLLGQMDIIEVVAKIIKEHDETDCAIKVSRIHAEQFKVAFETGDPIVKEMYEKLRYDRLVRLINELPVTNG